MDSASFPAHITTLAIINGESRVLLSQTRRSAAPSVLKHERCALTGLQQASAPFITPYHLLQGELRIQTEICSRVAVFDSS
ncbi:hypothetical protein E4T56_gene16226 [Termitomyces sp. T112]|nr:hypothetical protein E4T56_gene16226 [Termitomyces sp. T112]